MSIFSEAFVPVGPRHYLFSKIEAEIEAEVARGREIVWFYAVSDASRFMTHADRYERLTRDEHFLDTVRALCEHHGLQCTVERNPYLDGGCPRLMVHKGSYEDLD